MFKLRVPSCLMALLFPLVLLIPVSYAHAGMGDTGFVDVSLHQELGEHVAWAEAEGVSQGWSDHTFRPHLSVSREAMAAFLYRLAGKPSYAGSLNCFRDVSPATTQFSKEICWMKATGLTTGWEDGTFRPRESVQRLAAAAFFHRLAGSPEVTGEYFFFDLTDVPNDKFEDSIVWAWYYGIARGYDDLTFRGTQPVERIAMVTFLHRFSESEFMNPDLFNPAPKAPSVTLAQYKELGAKFGDTVRAKIFKLINEERAKRGLSVAIADKLLTNHAQSWAEFESRHDLLMHSIDPRTKGYADAPDIMKFSFSGEAIYSGDAGVQIGQGKNTADYIAEKSFRAWINSPAHEAILMGKNDDAIGIGVASTNGDSIYLVFQNDSIKFRKEYHQDTEKVEYENPNVQTLPAKDSAGNFSAVVATTPKVIGIIPASDE